MRNSDLMAWTVDDSRARRCKRWSQYPAEVIDLTVAEMDLPVADPVLAAVRDAVDRQAFGYPLPEHASRLPAVAADWLGSQGLPVPAEQVRLISDVIKAIVIGLRYLSPEGSPIVVITPTYSRFQDAVDAAGRVGIQVPMRAGPDGYALDLPAVEDALRSGARTVLLCNPSNPVGRVFRRDELAGLSELVERFGARTISDEIHAPLTYDRRFVSYASVSDVAAAHSFTVTSASKAWNIPGLRCAIVALTNPDDVARWDALPRAAKGGISPLGMEATIAAFSRGRPWLDNALGVLDGNRRALAAQLEGAGLDEVMHLPEATYLAWFDLRRLGVDDVRQFLLERAGVATTSGEEHGAGGAGFVRANFATPPDVLSDALDRIIDAVHGRSARRSA
ncbi:MalY/PatB family protein [Pseudonocardia sichuanensis]